MSENKKIYRASVAVLFLVFIFACTKEKPTWEYMPDMYNSPSFKVGEYAGVPVPGTLPRGYQPYLYKGDPEGAGQMKNPLPMTPEVFLTGQRQYQIYCSVCHGQKGLGDGPVIPKFPKPPSLQSDKVRSWPDGRIYHVMTEGQNLMPSYASQVRPEKRWAIIRYLRALQRAEHPTPQDVEAYEKERGLQ